MKFQPIETAPRDGTEILICFGSYRVSHAQYIAHPNPELRNFTQKYPWRFLDVGTSGEIFINASVDGEGGPSGWMPLPFSDGKIA